MVIRGRKEAALFALFLGGLLAANAYLMFEDGLAVGTSSSESAPSRDESEEEEPTPDRKDEE